ncbi:hypothetical protein B0H19DRAFT_1068421 [Mycena capillaripes]|nr:hypothetical protein B0H19DRAFT_1068421 [Mycena capillaripes]
MVEATSRSAMDSSEERSERDYKGLVWTMKSLTDDGELEPFVEAILDLFWDPIHRRKTYEKHIQGLLRDPEVQLLRRMGTLLRSCHVGILSANASQRQIMICFKALSAIAILPAPDHTSNDPALTVDFTYTHILNPNTHQRLVEAVIEPYTTSATAMMGLSTFLAVKGRLNKLQDHLAELDCEDGSPELKRVFESLEQIKWKLVTFGVLWEPNQVPENKFKLQSMIEKYLSHSLPHITLQCLSRAAKFKSPPYHWNQTLSTLRQSQTVPASFNFYVEFEYPIQQVFSTQVERLNAATDATKLAWVDESLSNLLSFWEPTISDCIPRTVIVFLNDRNSDGGLKIVLRHQLAGEHHLWNCFPRTLSQGTRHPFYELQQAGRPPLEDSFIALWRLAWLCTDYFVFPPRNLRLAALKSILEALSVSDSRFAHITHSIIALLKILVLQQLDSFEDLRGTLGEVRLNHDAFHGDTAMKIPDEFAAMNEHDEISASQARTLYISRHCRISEATIDVIAQYLENCVSKVLPYEALKTLEKIACYFFTRYPIHPIHPIQQMRLANSVHAIFDSEQSTELLDAIVDSRGHQTPEQVQGGDLHYPWLDDPHARQKVIDAFTGLQGTIKLILKPVGYPDPFGEHLARNQLLAPEEAVSNADAIWMSRTHLRHLVTSLRNVKARRFDENVRKFVILPGFCESSSV